MVAIQSLVYTALGGYAGLSALIGARVYPDIAAPGATRPYVVWQEVSLVQASDLGGSAQSGGLDNYRLQVTSRADGARGASIARDVDAQVRLAMIAASGFKSLLLDSRALEYEPDTKLHAVQSDFSVWLKT